MGCTSSVPLSPRRTHIHSLKKKTSGQKISIPPYRKFRRGVSLPLRGRRRENCCEEYECFEEFAMLERKARSGCPTSTLRNVRPRRLSCPLLSCEDEDDTTSLSLRSGIEVFYNSNTSNLSKKEKLGEGDYISFGNTTEFPIEVYVIDKTLWVWELGVLPFLRGGNMLPLHIRDVKRIIYVQSRYAVVEEVEEYIEENGVPEDNLRMFSHSSVLEWPWTKEGLASGGVVAGMPFAVMRCPSPSEWRKAERTLRDTTHKGSRTVRSDQVEKTIHETTSRSFLKVGTLHTLD